MSIDSILRENNLLPQDLRVLSVINDLTLATSHQVRDIIGLPIGDIKASFTRLSVSIIRRFGFPSLSHTHPLSGCYYGCRRSDLGSLLLPGYFRWARTGSTRFASRTMIDYGLYFRTDKSPGQRFYFANHAAMINFSAGWVVSTIRERVGWKVAFEGEQIIRHVRKWHYGRVVTLEEKSGGIAMSVPDFLLIRDGKILCCEVELHCKSKARYDAYFDHMDPDFSILYLVPSIDVARKIMKLVPRKANVDYAILTDTDGLQKVVSSLIPS